MTQFSLIMKLFRGNEDEWEWEEIWFGEEDDE